MLNAVSGLKVNSMNSMQASAYNHGANKAVSYGNTSLAPLSHDTVSFGMARLTPKGQERLDSSNVVDAPNRKSINPGMYKYSDAITKEVKKKLRDGENVNLKEIFNEYGRTKYPNKNAQFVEHVLANADDVFDVLRSGKGRRTINKEETLGALSELFKENLTNPYLSSQSRQEIFETFVDLKENGIDLGRGCDLDTVLLEYSDSGFDDENSKFIQELILPNVNRLKEVAPETLGTIFKNNVDNKELPNSKTRDFLKALSGDNSVLSFDEQSLYKAILKDRENTYGIGTFF